MMINNSFTRLFAAVALAPALAIALVSTVRADRPRRLPPVDDHHKSTLDASEIETGLDDRRFQIALRQSLAELGAAKNALQPLSPSHSSQPDRMFPANGAGLSESPIGSSEKRISSDQPIAYAPSSVTKYRLDQFTDVLLHSYDGVPQDSNAALPTTLAELPSLPTQLQASHTVASAVTSTVDPPTQTIGSRLTENHRIDLSRIIPHPNSLDFSQPPIDSDALYHDAGREAWVYDTKHNVPTQHPWIEWGRIWYGDGITPRGRDLFGPMNLVRPKFYVYGDYRTGIQAGRNAAGRADNWAHRLNLDMDL
ncbi:MAG: hypothetical protein KDB00_03050, partial [Planctomycetales bacterium]|nr:hypothetical protein [Planctomycetales bacterium]